MYFAKVEKRQQSASLELYDSDMKLLESESFADLSALNFHLQTVASKHKIQEALVVVHEPESGKVNLMLARGENSFFVS